MMFFFYFYSLTKNYELLNRRACAHKDTLDNLKKKLAQIENQHKYLEMEINQLRPQIMHLTQEKAYWMR